MIRFLTTIAIASGLFLAARSAAAEGSDVFEQRRKIEVVFAEQLERLATRYEQLGVAERARETRAWRIPRDPNRLYLFLPSEASPRKPVDAEDNSVETSWRRHFFAARNQQAERLVTLARQAIDADHADKAYQWLHEALHENPDHELARAALGFRIVNGRWRLPQGRLRVSTVRTPNPLLKFSARRHWRMESEHFSLLTDHSMKEGVKTVEQLEVMYSLWRQAFYRYWGAPAQLKKRLDAAAVTRRSARKFSVVLFQNREKYLQVLGPDQPMIGKTVGIYLDKRRAAYFYAGEQSTEATRYHEAGHQFFSEAAGLTEAVGQRNNFWVVEAIALYMESLQDHGDYYTLGGLDADRTQYARYRAYNQHFYVPLGELTGFSRGELQQHDELPRIYSQSAGLASYFLDRAPPPRRRAFIDYIKDVYRGRAGADSLGDRLGEKLRQEGGAPSNVDREYRQSLMVSDKDIAAWPHSELRKLALGHTQVTGQGLIHLGEQPQLDWLDLASVAITDESGPTLQRFTALEQLNLENTKITDGILPSLGRLKKLIDLDLSGTAITGAGLKHLSNLDQLEVLWLTGTDVDDDAILSLRSLKSLKRIHVRGTSVTSAGIKKLKSSLPLLQN